MWEGLDGSRVLAHMPPADTYNSQGFPEEVIRSAHKNKDAGVFDQSILLVGHGDGGGGPSPAMLESLKRMKDVDGVPKVSFGTPKKFFDELHQKEHLLPRWVGELYFELHRGTYTSQANVKWANRQCEFSLQVTEMCCALAYLSSGKQFKYPKESLDTSWKLVLKNSFHDTLPGSCIGLVYKETDADYKNVLQACLDAKRQACGVLNEVPLCNGVNGEQKTGVENGDSHSPGAQNYVLVFPSTFPLIAVRKSSRIAEVLGGPTLNDEAFNKFSQLKCIDRLRKHKDIKLVAMTEIHEGFGVSGVPNIEEVSKIENIVQVERREVEGKVKFVFRNDLVEAVVSGGGRLLSLVLQGRYGKREVLSTTRKGGSGNQLVLYDDIPMFWCAWDTEVYSFEKKVDIGDAIHSEIVEQGPLRSTVYLRYPATKGGSVIEQYISVCSGSARVDFVTHVNWNESRKILRVLFDTEIRSAVANYQTQFGYVQRPTTWNHSWDVARFEVVGHQFCDLSEHKFGMALMSDCKYGYSVRDNTMRLSLLRASKSPDDDADIGDHTFTYSVLPHWENFPNVDVLSEAHRLNQPTFVPAWVWSDDGKSLSSLLPDLRFRLDNEETATELGVVGVSCFKRAERHDDRFVLRVFEACGGRGSACIRFPDKIRVSQANLCNMLEDVIEDNTGMEVSEHGSLLRLSFTPFQIRTIILELKFI